MTAAEKSRLGLAKQTAKGSPVTADASFKYMLFRTGNMAPNNIVLPLDQEVGGGPMLRNVVKVGVNSAGALDFIPRPDTLGLLLLGVLGSVSTTQNVDGSSNPDGSYTHVFKLPASDPFDAPWFTIRSSPGGLWGEQFDDCRVASLALNFAGARFVEGAVAFVGGRPQKVSASAWNPDNYLDGGPQFLSPLGSIEVPTMTAVSVLSGSVAWTNQIVLDEQYVVGRYEPEDLPINQRAMVITLNVKISDDQLYTKMMYDPAAGSAWVADMFKEADIKLYFESPEYAASSTNRKYSIDIDADPSNNNVVWTAAPIGVRAGRQLVMSVTGTVLASPGDPMSVTLVNTTASY